MKLQTVEAEKILDVRSLTCPLPVIKSMKALEYMYAGSILEIWCVTTEFKDELDQYIDEENCEYLGSLDDPDGFKRFFVRKGRLGHPCGIAGGRSTNT